MVGWLVGCLVVWLFVWLFGSLVGYLVIWLVETYRGLHLQDSTEDQELAFNKDVTLGTEIQSPVTHH